MLAYGFIRFIVAGIINTSMTFGVFLLLSPLLGSHWAYTVAYVAGIALSYLFNSWLVFRVQPTLSSAAAFPLVYVGQYLWGLVVMTVAVGWLGWSDRHGLALAIVTSAPLTFALSRCVLNHRGSLRGDAAQPLRGDADAV